MEAPLYLSKHDSLCLLIFNAGDLFVTAELVEKCLVVSIGVATPAKRQINHRYRARRFKPNFHLMMCL